MDEQNNRSLWIILGGLAGLVVLFSLCALGLFGSYLIMDSETGASSQVIIEPADRQVDRAAPAATVAPPEPIEISEDVEDYETAVLTSIYEQVSPSVVNINVLSSGESLQEQQPFLFPPGEEDGDGTQVPELEVDPESLFPRGQGSGFVWDGEGHIVTNAHVVADADQVQVNFQDGTIGIAEVIGVDEHSDLAVLKIASDGYNLRPIILGNIDEVKPGQRVAAIGNPFAFEGTLTSGIVSAVGRSIPALTPFSIPEAIQTDAVINPGNSGGPLLNERGQLIGVNAQIRVSELNNTGIGFAIPVSIVERVVPALINEGRYEHSYIGIRGNTYSPVCADDLDLPRDVRGAYVDEVLSGTPASRAGLQGGSEPSGTNLLGICPETKGGDLVTAIDGEQVTRFDDLLIYLERNTSPEDTVTLTVIRDGQTREIEVTLEARPDNP